MIGSLCSGYGGLDMAAQAVFGGELAWWSDIHPAAVKVMTHHHPDAPNVGDLRTVTWWDTPPVRIMSAGYPCQPFSSAGRRRGIDDPRHLWPWVARAIGALRPEVVVLENVAAHLGRGFDLVLADLAVLGYDAAWTVVRAADVGAPHRRARLFIVAADADRALGGRQGSLASGSTEGVEPEAVRGAGRSGSASAADTFGEPVREQPGRRGRARRARTPELGRRDEATADAHGTGCGPRGGIPGPNGTAAVGDSPSAAADADRHGKQQRPGDLTDVTRWADDGGEVPLAWGKYGPAIHRWELAIGRSAPAPTVLTGRYGRRLRRRIEHRDRRPVGMRGSLRPEHQLSECFVEWMMGLNAGHVTAVPGLSRNDMLHVLGNGVVPQCAAWAIAELAHRLGLPSDVERAA